MNYTDPTKEYDPDFAEHCPNCGDVLADYLTGTENFEWVEKPEVVQRRGVPEAVWNEDGELTGMVESDETYEEVIPGIVKCDHCGEQVTF